ncbi:MAG: sensor histidine kinase [Chloroflexi bacterium]|nr:sensor histidine kinase [Chloroflexota bacterium]
MNSVVVTNLLIVPPQVFRSLAGFAMAVTIIRALEVFEVETDRLIERMEEAQVIVVERERIGRDLHDGAIQRVYAAGLIAQSLRYTAEGAIAEGLDRLMATLNEAIADLRHFLSDLRPGDSAADLTGVLAASVDEARRASGADLRFRAGPGALPALTPDRVTHLAAFAREALSNAIRHAQARTIEMTVTNDGGGLRLTVRDDGRGLPSVLEAGYGLRNMRDRARLLGGEVTFDSAPGKGTAITLTIPLEREP